MALREVCLKIEPVQRSVLLKHELLQSPPEKSFLVHGGEVAKWRHCGVCNCKRTKLPSGVAAATVSEHQRAEAGLRCGEGDLVSRPSSLLEIIEFWRAMPLGKPPFIHPEDLPAMQHHAAELLAETCGELQPIPRE